MNTFLIALAGLCVGCSAVAICMKSQAEQEKRRLGSNYDHREITTPYKTFAIIGIVSLLIAALAIFSDSEYSFLLHQKNVEDGAYFIEGEVTYIDTTKGTCIVIPTSQGTFEYLLKDVEISNKKDASTVEITTTQDNFLGGLVKKERVNIAFM